MDQKRKNLETFDEKSNEILANFQNEKDSDLLKKLLTTLDKTITYLNKEEEEKFESDLQSFVTTRVSEIKKEETPQTLEPNPKVILHLIPLNTFERNYQSIDIKDLHHSSSLLAPLATFSYDYKYNFDGYVTYNKNGYTQLFRKGYIEAVSGRFYNEDSKNIYITEFERSIIQNVGQYMKVLNTLDIQNPFYIYITLTNVKGYTLGTSYTNFSDSNEIDKQDISLPRVLLEDPENIALPLKAAFDVLWNSGGAPESINYQNGEWKPR